MNGERKGESVVVQSWTISVLPSPYYDNHSFSHFFFISINRFRYHQIRSEQLPLDYCQLSASKQFIRLTENQNDLALLPLLSIYPESG